MSITKSFIYNGNMKPKTYLTHWNGGTDFKVDVSKDSISISTDYYSPKYNFTFLKLNKFIGYWEGVGCEELGVAILIQITLNKYLYVGTTVYYFKTNDYISDFYNCFGANDVPYPVGIGLNNLYLFEENTYVKKEQIKLKINEYNLQENNIYRYYYGYIDHKGKQLPEKRHTLIGKKIKLTKLIHPSPYTISPEMSKFNRKHKSIHPECLIAPFKFYH